MEGFTVRWGKVTERASETLEKQEKQAQAQAQEAAE